MRTSLFLCQPSWCLSSQLHDTVCQPQDEAAAVAYLQAIRKVRSDIEEDWRRMQEAAPGVMLSIFRDLVASISADVQESEPVAGQWQCSASVPQSLQGRVAANGLYHTPLCYTRNAVRSTLDHKPSSTRHPTLH